jgi:NAD(P)H-dependent FMN reductase
MIVVLSGTNRPNSNTRRVAALAAAELENRNQDHVVLDLHALPPDLFDPESYAQKPPAFDRFQHAVLAAKGIIVVTPEYNGSFPGVLKYFIDMLQFPESLYETPTAFIGLSAGRWGASRAVEQLTMVFQYRHAHLFGKRLFLPQIGSLIDESGALAESDSAARLSELVAGFCEFCNRLNLR